AGCLREEVDMAYRELGLVGIREVLRRWLTGDGLRAIARGTGVDRKTIAKYVRAAAALGLPRGGPLPTDEQIAAVRHQACPPAIETPSDEQQTLWPHRETIQTWLRQGLPPGLDGLEAAWAFFGGVVRRLVVDNFKPAVTRADRYTPTLDRVFLEYAQYRGFVVDPAVPRHATGKPKVERGIPYVREDFFRGEVYRDLDDMQARAVRWCRDLAGTRIHGTTRRAPRVVFETEEQPTLLPLGPEPFDRPTWAQCTVHPDHHIQFQRALYSVPTHYIGAAV